jgi:hypothetical protein
LISHAFHSKPLITEAGPSALPRRFSRRSAAAAATEIISEAPPLADPEELYDHFYHYQLLFSYLFHQYSCVSAVWPWRIEYYGRRFE